MLETSTFLRREQVNVCKLPVFVLHPAESSYMVPVLLKDEDSPPLPLVVKALHEQVCLMFYNCLRSDSPFTQPLAEWDNVG